MRLAVLKRTNVILALALFAGACASSRGKVTVINQSAEPIEALSLTVCEQKLELPNLAPGANSTWAYKVRNDCDYAMSVRFASGRQLNRQLGYVTSGFKYEDELIVTGADVVIKRKSTK